MGWRDFIEPEKEPERLPEMTTIYDANTQSIQLILWADYIGKGYQAYDFGDRARRRRSTAFKRSAAGENEIMVDDVEGCDIASPIRDFMEETLRITNENIRKETGKVVGDLKAEMTAIKASQAATEKENENLKKKLEESHDYINKLKEDMDQVQKATWENRNVRLEMKNKIEEMDQHMMQKDPSYQKAVLEKQDSIQGPGNQSGAVRKRAPIPDYVTVYNARTRQADLMLQGEYLNANRPVWKQEWAVIYDEVNKCPKLVFWKNYVKYHEPAFMRFRRGFKIAELQRTFDTETTYAPLEVRTKIAVMKFWVRTLDLPEEDDFRQAYERARELFEKGNTVGVEVPKSIFETLLEVDMELIWQRQTVEVYFEGHYSFLKELRIRLQQKADQGEDGHGSQPPYPKLEERPYTPKKECRVLNGKKIRKPTPLELMEMEKAERERLKEEEQRKRREEAVRLKEAEELARKNKNKKPLPPKKKWDGLDSYQFSEAAGEEADPFMSMMLQS